MLERRREGLAGAGGDGAPRMRSCRSTSCSWSRTRAWCGRSLAATLPFERVIVGRYRIRVSRADVHFEDGFGLVRLDGEASFADRAERRVMPR